MRYQMTLMKHSPSSGLAYHGMAAPLASRYRQDNPTVTWYFDPWTGLQRREGDIRKDPYGHAITPPGEQPRPSRRARDVTNELRDILDAPTNMNILFQPSAEQVAQIASEVIVVDPGLERWYAETLARQLLDSTVYANEVSARVRNHARRVLGIAMQEPE